MAIKNAIKPGFIALYFKSFNIKMLKDYFNRLAYEDNQDLDFLKFVAEQKVKTKI